MTGNTTHTADLPARDVSTSIQPPARKANARASGNAKPGAYRCTDSELGSARCTDSELGSAAAFRNLRHRLEAVTEEDASIHARVHRRT